jgi:hypothetical protein
MTARAISENTLYYGDNLPILREYMPDENGADQQRMKWK